jgi:hypothetical protein
MEPYDYAEQDPNAQQHLNEQDYNAMNNAGVEPVQQYPEDPN